MIERTLLHFNKTDRRIYVLRSILWRIYRQDKKPSNYYASILYRLKLINIDRELTALGERLAKRHEHQFKQLKIQFDLEQANKPKRVLSPEHIAKMRAGRRNAKQE